MGIHSSDIVAIVRSLMCLCLWNVAGSQSLDTAPIRSSFSIAGYTKPGFSLAPPVPLETMQFNRGEDNARSLVIDSLRGYAYVGTHSSEDERATIVKVKLGAGDAPPTRVGALVLEPGEDYLTVALMDEEDGYAYFVVGGDPSRIVKIKLGQGDDAPVRVGALELHPLDRFVESGVIDASNNFAYFGSTSKSVIKISLGTGDELPTRIGSAPMDYLEWDMRCAVIDPDSGYAYFGASTAGAGNPGSIVKVALGAADSPPSRIGSIKLQPGEKPSAAVIDLSNGYAYFGTSNVQGRVIKVALNSGDTLPTLIGAVELNPDELNLAVGMIDESAGIACFLSGADGRTRATTISLGAGSALPTRIAGITLPADLGSSLCGGIDSQNNFGYFSTTTAPASVCKFSLGDALTAPSMVASCALQRGEEVSNVALFHEQTGHIYLGTNPGGVLKIFVGDGSESPRRVGYAALEPDENWIGSGVIDPIRGHAYIAATDLSSQASVSSIAKVALGEGDQPPVRVSSRRLSNDERYLNKSFADPGLGFAYFYSESSQKLVQIALESGDVPPRRVGAITVNHQGDSIGCTAIDSINHFAYFGTTHPGKIWKLQLGNIFPHRAGSLTLPPDEWALRAAMVDAEHGYGYFGMNPTGSPAKVVKIALGEGNVPVTRIGTVLLNSEEGWIGNGVLNPTKQAAYIAASGGRVVTIALGAGDSLPFYIGKSTNSPPMRSLDSPVIDVANGYIYFTIEENPGGLAKFALGPKGAMQGNRISMPESGLIEDFRFYSHSASGNVRLALYSCLGSQELLWQSEVVSNDVNEGDIVVPVSSGVPSSLQLAPGTYWLAWQVDSMGAAPSYIPGGLRGEGLFVRQEFGPAPANLQSAPVIATDQRWTCYLTYTPAASASENWLAIED